MGQQTFSRAIEHADTGPNNLCKLCLNGPKRVNRLVRNGGCYLTNYGYFYSQIGQFAFARLFFSFAFNPSLL
jgi:hypothetical protein